jgi:hypothetical protein
MVHATRAPRTKEELLNKALSHDAGINFRNLAENVSIVRVAPHIVRLTFPDTQTVFDLTVHIPRAAHKMARGTNVGVLLDDWEQPHYRESTRKSGSNQ